MSKILRTRAATMDEEIITVICEHDFTREQTDNGHGAYCWRCGVFRSESWFSPQTIIAERSR